jgi:transposase
MRKSEQVARELQRRRLRGGRLLLRGESQAEVARRVGVTRSTVSDWNELLGAGGLEALKRRPRGRPRGSRRCAASRTDADLDARRPGRGVRHRAVDAATGGKVDRTALRSWVQREPGVAHPGGARLLLPATLGTSARARRGGDPALEEDALAGAKKNAAKQGRIIVFVDESGLSERPTRVRTWAPRGQTPVLQYHFNWHQLSVIAGISFRRFYFRLFPGAIKSPQIIEFLHALGRQIRQPVLVIWDGLPAHRSALVHEYLEALNGAIQIERLPGYAPELNPTEYIWGHLKHHELANHCAGNFVELKAKARNRLRSMQRRPTLIRAFWQQADLAF